MTDRTELTVDELARRAGMTVRNVRAYQSRGLIPPPALRGRTGFYGDEHLARLELIKDLQAEGFNLQAIKRILEGTPGGAVAEVLDFTRAAAAPFGDEEPIVIEGSALVERWGEQLTPELATQAQRLGLVRDLGDGRFEVRSPRLDKVAQELSELGVPLQAVTDTMGTMRRAAQSIARAHVNLFLEHVWRPFEQAGSPPERWPDVREALERLRPLAAESLLGVFQLVMTETVERTIERELGEAAGTASQARRRDARAPRRSRRR